MLRRREELTTLTQSVLLYAAASPVSVAGWLRMLAVNGLLAGVTWDAIRRAALSMTKVATYYRRGIDASELERPISCRTHVAHAT